mmetsp:Transcript_73582/g.207154  ORF Transcript_73582/g.207154 Transcript_73582/m.207154 type:complete len:259 (+) Transcript_73582:82-858(+)
MASRLLLEVLGAILAVALGAWWGSSAAVLNTPLNVCPEAPSELLATASPPGAASAWDRSLFFGDAKDLTHVTSSARRLPGEVYRRVVDDLIITCIDVLLEASDGRYLLVVREDEPGAGWAWLIGGRMWKGETFFGAAMRKVKEEVGLEPESLRPGRVLNVWNTFFNTTVHRASAHAEGSEPSGPATQTVNVVVHLLAPSLGGGENLSVDNHHSGFRWVGPDDASLVGVEPYVLAAIASHRSGVGLGDVGAGPGRRELL